MNPIIQFWLAYWKNEGLSFPKIDPLLVKTIIAVESSFRPKADPKSKHSSAYGLMQITNQSRRVLRGDPDKNGYRELRSQYLRVSREDLEDPVVNIGAGIRVLAHKHRLRKSEKGDPLYNMVKAYYSWNKDGDDYAKKVFELYKASKKSN
ncbi:MAG: hypothetical protein COV44_02335 [Deltaproteobacteria bacterium CG11_big_fil_rev_8_21_14_0_20_45_16]|nr:MAG: hypothetical protein COV44_02335 [Deltaproteobacteria bacterium CG11_big_fil_rev_8_21_14_0_20_45_16]